MKIQILMSSYNGEKYIEKQIESILKQKHVEVSILIRDDGSSDSTPEIIKKIKERNQNIDCICEKNIGVKKSFLKLVKLANPEVDYYAFSDQDDIWLEDKLFSAVEKLRNEKNSIPLVYGSPVFLYAGETIIGKQFEHFELNLGNFIIKNYFPGCTMVFNKKLKELIDIVDYKVLNSNPLHDHWLNLVCTACGGKVIMDTEPHMLYRQHRENVIGNRGFKQKVMENGIFTKNGNIRLKICQELHRLYFANESEESKKILQMVLNYQENVRGKMTLIFDRRIKTCKILENIVLYINIILGKF